MHLPTLISAFALMVVPAAAFAQDAGPSAADLKCQVFKECGEATTTVEQAPDTRGFRLAAPRTVPVAAQRPQEPRNGVARALPRPQVDAGRNPSPLAVAKRPVAAQPGVGQAGVGQAGIGRADLQLQFGSGSTELLGSDLSRVRTLAAAMLAASGDKRIRIEGHTDAVGSRQSNLELSRRRAQSVADAMIAAGVASDRIEVVGYGPDKPISANGRENRRVEAVLIR